MADNKEVLGLDLDITGFKEGIATAKDGLQSLGSGDLTGLSNTLLKMAGDIGIVAVAALALKVTFDEVFKGDQIKRTSDLFDDLAKNFDLAGNELKDNLIKAAGGLADTSSIIESATKAMIGLGQNSGMIPQIMEVARKSTLAFGGDVTERFNQLSLAITSGNARMLRANGIFIDAQKALRDYAVSIGATTGELNEAGRQHAIFNAVMEYTANNLKAVNVEQDNSITAWQKFKAEAKEAADAIALAFNKAFGPTVIATLKAFGEAMHGVAVRLQSEFGTGAENAAAKVQILQDKLTSIDHQIAEAEERKGKGGGGLFSRLLFGDVDKELEKLHAQQKQIQADIATAQAKEVQAKEKTEEKKTQVSKVGNAAREIDQQKAAMDRIKLEDEVLKIQEKNAAESVKMANSETVLKESQSKRLLADEQRAALEKKKIRQQLANGEISDRKLAAVKEKAIDADLHNKKIAYMRAERAEHKKMLQNMVDDSQNIGQGISNVFQQQAAIANDSLTNFGNHGKIVFDALKTNAVSSFEELGKAAVDHSKSASEIMKGFFLNALADMAQAEGELFLVAGIADPSKLAAGAALLVLSGALRAMAGSSGASSSSISAGGGGGGGITSAAAATENQPSAQAQPTGNLTLNINGDYLNTAETQRTLLQAVRDATDQTGFQYLQIGQTGAQSY